jgi:thioredoxin 1
LKFIGFFNKEKNMEETNAQVVHLTTQDFKEKVFNYEVGREWKYEGQLPAIIDFYADWCGPCKIVAPILEELARDYAGKIVVYKVNTENEQDLASAFGIQSIPTLLFVPTEGQPQAAMGALPRHTFEKVIQDVLLKN